MININGEQWRVFLTSPFHPALKRSDGAYTLGCCDDVTKTIYISNDVSNKYLKKVLCHELTHAAMFSYNVDLTYEQEEVLADIIATYGQEIIHMANLLFKRLKDEREEERKNGSI